jgi:predicted small lipoprotein YifL
VALSDRPIWFRSAVGLVILAAFGLSACGRNGPLEPPPSAKVTNPDGTTAPDTGPTKPHRHFFLDSLI